ncbi:MAG: FAD-binding oxidoreductase [Gemmatimonadales bacterium]
MAPLSIEGLVQRDLRLRSAYAEGAGIYRILPAGVALPASLVELKALIRWAAESGTALTARGAGSSIPGSAVGAGIIVDLRERMPRRLEINAESRTAITSANITQQELNAAALPYGLRLPPDPSSSRWATLGGMVSTNAAGARTVRYGPARKWVDALEIVTADGDVVWLERGAPSTGTTIDRFHHDAVPALRAAAGTIGERFPRTRKNTAGYALDAWLASGDDLDLFVGAEGTLGLITTIRWRLDPIPAARAGLRISLGRLDQLEEAVVALVALDPSAIELLDRTFLDLVSERAGTGREAVGVPEGTEAVLLVEFERNTAAQVRGVVGDAVRAVKEISTDIATALTPEEEQRLWALRHAASPILASLPPERRSLQVIEDGCVPLSHLGEYVAAIRLAAQRWRITAVIFGHAGDGHLHVNLLPELAELDWPARVRGLYTEVSAAVMKLGGTVSGEHGDGRLRAPLLAAQYGPAVMDLFQQVKTAFDPEGIFNPGVKLPRGSSPFRNLKVGLDVTPIPDDIALALREIERSGGYARSRVEIAEGKPDAGDEQAVGVKRLP